MESAISSVALKARFGLNAMLLWPLHKNTSPKATFESVCDFPPDVLICGEKKKGRKKKIILYYSMSFRCNATALRLIREMLREAKKNDAIQRCPRVNEREMTWMWMWMRRHTHLTLMVAPVDAGCGSNEIDQVPSEAALVVQVLPVSICTVTFSPEVAL